jgi:hypothetical protein
MLTRAEVQQRLGIERTKLRRMEVAGTIRPQVDQETGWHWFHPGEVAEIAEKRSAVSHAARARKLYAQGKSITEVIIELECDPMLARSWKQAYDDDENAHRNQITITLPHDLKVWSKVFGASEKDLRNPLKLLCALELCLSIPEMRAQLEVNIERARNEQPSGATVLP